MRTPGIALIAGVAGCSMLAACAPQQTIATTAPLNACTLLQRNDFAKAFVLGLPEPPRPMNADFASASCGYLVHTQNGDLHLVVTTATAGTAAFATVCSPGVNPDVKVLGGIPDKACWNPDDTSVSAERRGVFYSVAVLDPGFPEQSEPGLVVLMGAIVTRH